MVAGGHHMPVGGRRLPDQLGDGGGDIGTPDDREAASLAEIVLHVYDDQGAAHGGCPSAIAVGMKGSAARPVNFRA
ncbi:hypothetical protein GCM10020256_48270 [Streptomyces thermocoprophilus]